MIDDTDTGDQIALASIVIEQHIYEMADWSPIVALSLAIASLTRVFNEAADPDHVEDLIELLPTLVRSGIEALANDTIEDALDTMKGMTE